jgi:Haem-containing dehydratase
VAVDGRRLNRRFVGHPGELHEGANEQTWCQQIICTDIHDAEMARAVGIAGIIVKVRVVPFDPDIEARVPRWQHWRWLLDGAIAGAQTHHELGLLRLLGSMSDPIIEHGYWGSMRDRLPLSQTDQMDPSGELTVKQGAPAKGGRVIVGGHDNLALIRSGEDWSLTEGEERRSWFEDIEPVLHEGMNYLRDDGLEGGRRPQRREPVLPPHLRMTFAQTKEYAREDHKTIEPNCRSRSLGNVRSETLRAFSVDEMRRRSAKWFDPAVRAGDASIDAGAPTTPLPKS